MSTPSSPPGSPPSSPELARPTRANWILAGLIAAFGSAVFVATVVSGKQDSAMLFVGAPTLLAAALALMPGRSTHGRVFRLTTIALLLAAVALHEGAICVVLAAPLVYLIAHVTTWMIQTIRGTSRGAYALLPIPLLMFGGVEGTADNLRINPDQTVTVVRTVSLTPAEVLARLAAGPEPVEAGSLPLRLLGMPLPQQVSGDGLQPGDRWMFAYHGSSHGPGGHVVAEVVTSTTGRIEFSFVEDTTINARWFKWRSASIGWQAAGDGQTGITLTIDYRRGLDPSWYFGPLQDGLMRAGGGHLLDMLALT